MAGRMTKKFKSGKCEPEGPVDWLLYKANGVIDFIDFYLMNTETKA